MPTDSQRFHVCPVCGWVIGYGGEGRPTHCKGWQMFPAQVIAFPAGEPSPEQIEAGAEAVQASLNKVGINRRVMYADVRTVLLAVAEEGGKDG